MMDNTDSNQTTTQAASQPARLNPFSFPSDTDLRFILLIVCVLGASLWIYNLGIWRAREDFLSSANVVLSCEKSSGMRTAMLEIATGNPKGVNDLAVASAANAQCVASFEFHEAMRMLSGVVLLLIVTVSIYLLFPAWKRWRNRLVPLPREDLPEVMVELTALCDEAGLKKRPQFLWNPLNPVSEGLAFGCMGRNA
jgi:hypothetical protein